MTDSRPPTLVEVGARLANALAHHQHGDLDAAETLYVRREATLRGLDSRRLIFAAHLLGISIERAPALQLALQPELLRMVKNRLSEARDGAAVFDTTRFRGHLEQAFETMCRIRDRGESPAGFTLQSD